MHKLALFFIALNGVLHFNFLILEMFLWNKPLGMKVFKHSKEKAEATRVLAANQGLYNGFLAAGLIWSLVRGDAAVATFFLMCVFIAGIYGAITASRTILYVQAIPALLGLLALHFL